MYFPTQLKSNLVIYYWDWFLYYIKMCHIYIFMKEKNILKLEPPDKPYVLS